MPLPAGQSGAGVATAALDTEPEDVALLEVEAEVVEASSSSDDETVDDFELAEACVEADPSVDVTVAELRSLAIVVPFSVVCAAVLDVVVLSGHVLPGLQGSTEQHPRKPFAQL